jgi:hypothetical protein
MRFCKGERMTPEAGRNANVKTKNPSVLKLKIGCESTRRIGNEWGNTATIIKKDFGIRTLSLRMVP